jgi:hypothetical protein
LDNDDNDTDDGTETDSSPPKGTPTASRGAGRPSKFDQAIADTILRALAAGAWKKAACAFAGIDYCTFKRWMLRGRKHPSKYPELADFARRVEAAINGCEIQAGRVAYKGALSDPKLAIEWLKVRHRRRWNPKQRVEVSGSAKHPVHLKHDFPVDLSRLSDDELHTLEGLTEKVAAAGPSDDSDGEGEA